ncbi:MAG TPA: DUF86 domain-containing protein [Blastocatellia bacterium]|nr:DUF86 domain-containing protein [Blastocatellia bacterium]
MIDKDLVRKKLRELSRYVAELETLRQLPFEQLTSRLRDLWSVEHGLQLSIQVVLDIGNHILAALGETAIEEYADVIDKLGERGILPREFARRIRGMAGFRNILVHEYVEVDRREVYEVLQNRLDDFRAFARYIEEYLTR